MRKAVVGIVLCLAGMAWAEEVVIAALGDSLTQGYGLPADDGFVPQLQRWLDSHGREVRLINAGVSGDTTAGGLARIDWTLTPDVDGLIVALGANDLLRGLDPDKARDNLDGILMAARAAKVDVLLVGMQSYSNYGADYKDRFEAIYPELAAKYDTLYAPSFFAGLMQDDVLPEMLSLLPMLQADALHPNADGVAQIVDGLGPRVLELLDKAEQ